MSQHVNEVWELTLPTYFNLAEAIIRNPDCRMMGDTVYESLKVNDIDFKLVARLPNELAFKGGPWKVRYEIKTEQKHSLNGEKVDPQDLHDAVLKGFPLLDHILERLGHFDDVGSPMARDFDFTDYWESVMLNDVTISVHHRHGFQEEYGAEPGFSLALRKGSEKRFFKLQPEVVAQAVKQSEMIFAHALGFAPDASKTLTTWLNNVPGIQAAYRSDVEKAELEQMIGPHSQSKKSQRRP